LIQRDLISKSLNDVEVGQQYQVKTSKFAALENLDDDDDDNNDKA